MTEDTQIIDTLGLPRIQIGKFRPSADTQTPRRAIITLGGPQRTGKTDMAVRTTPEPVLYFNMDKSSEGVVNRVAQELAGISGT